MLGKRRAGVVAPYELWVRGDSVGADNIRPYHGWQFCRGGHCPPAFNGAFWEWRAHDVRPYTRIYDSFRASIAAIRERIRIFTAPRLLISSIFSWVYSLPPSSRMERISSPVMASMPQPKLTS